MPIIKLIPLELKKNTSLFLTYFKESACCGWEVSLWATIVIYYAEYYALYSFLQRIGIKSENHFCSILAVSKLLGNEKVSIIKLHKEKRIDAQYYIKVGKKNQIKEMLNQAKFFVSEFDELVANFKKEDFQTYRQKLETKNI